LLLATRSRDSASHYRADSENYSYPGIQRRNFWTWRRYCLNLVPVWGIGGNVWKNGGDIRDVISIGKLVRKSDGPEQIELIIKTMTKYGIDGRENDS
jgi:hypothetical protein